MSVCIDRWHVRVSTKVRRWELRPAWIEKMESERRAPRRAGGVMEWSRTAGASDGTKQGSAWASLLTLCRRDCPKSHPKVERNTMVLTAHSRSPPVAVMDTELDIKRTPLCRTYTNLTNMVKCIRIYTNLSYSFDCCHTSCFNVHCLSTRSYTDSTSVLRLLATRGDG